MEKFKVSFTFLKLLNGNILFILFFFHISLVQVIVIYEYNIVTPVKYSVVIVN